MRAALLQRLNGPGAKEIAFDFQVQIRSKAELAGKVETEVEDSRFEWDERKFGLRYRCPHRLPPRNVDTPERKRQCENLFFTPWLAVAEH